MINNYFFVDGSALLAQIRTLWRVDPSFSKRKLCPKLLLQYYMRTLCHLHGGQYKRATFYFPEGDQRNVDDHLAVPNHNNPGEIIDLHFKYCGIKIKKSTEFDNFVETQVPSKFHNRFSKSEKGIDIEICCDALKLASASRLERLFLFTNDEDFVPLCRALKEFGSNISIIHLTEKATRNISLLREADSFDVVNSSELQSVFSPDYDNTSATISLPEAGVASSAMKPDAAPSDLDLLSTVSGPESGEAASPDR